MITLSFMSALAAEPLPEAERAPAAAIPVAEAEPGAERLDGVRLGLGMSFYLIATSAADLERQSGLTGGSSVSARLRLGRGFTFAPSLRVSNTYEALGARVDEEDGEPTDEYASLALSGELEARFRLAHHQRMDLLGLAGVSVESSEIELREGGESADPTRTSWIAGSLDLGVGLEYWITPEISLGADVSVSVLTAGRLQDDSAFDEWVRFGLTPRSATSLTFYF